MITALIMHIRSGIDMDQEAHTGYDEHKEHRQLIYLKCEGNIEVSGPYEIKQANDDGLKSLFPCFLENDETQQK